MFQNNSWSYCSSYTEDNMSETPLTLSVMPQEILVMKDKNQMKFEQKF